MAAIPEFMSALETMASIHKTKNQDYADPNNAFSNFDTQEYVASLFKNDRDKVFATMFAVKMARLATLLNKESAPNHESIEDTFIDGANYLLLWRADHMRRIAKRPIDYDKVERVTVRDTTVSGVNFEDRKDFS